MIDEQRVAAHYGRGRLLEALREGLARMGKSTADVTADDLAVVEEFHVGGRQATADFHTQLGWRADQQLLDVGCGIGGPARWVARHSGARVTGIDLTPEYVDTGNAVSGWLGLAERVRLQAASALQLPFDDDAFDGGYMMHVGMNIADKPALFAEVARVLKPGAIFGIYDVMRVGEGEVAYPLPWAETADTSRLAAPEDYSAALDGAGFDVVRSRNRREFALEFFAQVRAKMAGAAAPPPLGMQLVMGASAADMMRHLIQGLSAGRIAPVEMVAKRRG
jgi:SAM-dependent methyltransferase